jgi:hypothetical protein
MHGIRVHWIRGIRHVKPPVQIQNSQRFRLLVIEEMYCPAPAMNTADEAMRLI